MLYIIDNNNNERDLLVHHKPLLEIDDDLKVPFDDYFDDISAESWVYVFPRLWHYF